MRLSVILNQILSTFSHPQKDKRKFEVELEDEQHRLSRSGDMGQNMKNKKMGVVFCFLSWNQFP